MHRIPSKNLVFSQGVAGSYLPGGAGGCGGGGRGHTILCISMFKPIGHLVVLCRGRQMGVVKDVEVQRQKTQGKDRERQSRGEREVGGEGRAGGEMESEAGRHPHLELGPRCLVRMLGTPVGP